VGCFNDIHSHTLLFDHFFIFLSFLFPFLVYNGNLAGTFPLPYIFLTFLRKIKSVGEL
jgi:hypothetical protein